MVETKSIDKHSRNHKILPQIALVEVILNHGSQNTSLNWYIVIPLVEPAEKRKNFFNVHSILLSLIFLTFTSSPYETNKWNTNKYFFFVWIRAPLNSFNIVSDVE